MTTTSTDPEITNALSFASWLSSQLELRRMSQAQLADSARVTRTTISCYAGARPDSRTGRPNVPTIQTVDKIARGLGASIAEARAAAGYASDPLPQLSTLDRFTSLFRELSESRQRDILRIMTALQDPSHLPRHESPHEPIDDLIQVAARKNST